MKFKFQKDLLIESIKWFAKNYTEGSDTNIAEVILNSKFGEIFTTTVKNSFIDTYDDSYFSNFAIIISDLYLREHKDNNALLKQISSDLDDKHSMVYCAALLGLMAFSYNIDTDINTENYDTQLLILVCFKMDKLDLFKDKQTVYCFAWALAWLELILALPLELRISFSNKLINAWVSHNEKNISRTIAWALSLILRPSLKNKLSINCIKPEFVYDKFKNPVSPHDKLTAVYINYLFDFNLELDNIALVFPKFQSISDYKNAMIEFSKELKINLQTNTQLQIFDRKND